MKKILGLTVVALLVMGLVGTGTWAYFSDPETSTGNILTAGTLDLTVDAGDSPVTTLSVSDTYPGDTGSGSTTLKNNGSIAGELDITFGTVSNTESTGATEYEADDIGGAGVGELGGQATIAVFIDVDESATWTSGDIGLKSDLSTYDFAAGLDYATLDSYSGDDFNDVYTGTMANGTQDGFIIMYLVPTTADNTIQGDSVSVDITFTLEQVAVD